MTGRREVLNHAVPPFTRDLAGIADEVHQDRGIVAQPGTDMVHMFTVAHLGAGN